jgi:hypothetical protein
MSNWFRPQSMWRVNRIPQTRAQREKGREIKAKLATIFAREREQRARPEQLPLLPPRV